MQKRCQVDLGFFDLRELYLTSTLNLLGKQKKIGKTVTNVAVQGVFKDGEEFNRLRE